MGHNRVDILLTLTAQWLTLWLGLSLLRRRPRSAANWLAAAAFLIASAYLLSVALLLTSESGNADLFWDRWLSNWAFFAPVLLLHAFLRLTGTRLPRQRLVLVLLYVAAAATVAVGIWTPWFFTYQIPSGLGAGAKGVFVPGRLEFLQAVQALVTFAFGLFVLVRSRRVGPAVVRPQLDLVIAGMGLLLFAGAAAFINLYTGSLRSESLLEIVGVTGALLVTVPLMRYRGSLDGQLLRSDLKSSLLASALLMGIYVLLMTAVGASEQLIAGLGWFVLTVFLLSDELRALADRAFYGAGSRAGRAGLRTAASYAGASETLDLGSLSPQKSAELVEYLVALDRAGLAAARLEGPGSRRLELLAGDGFAEVRDALGLPADWQPADGPPGPGLVETAAQRLEPRERQVLGLKYLGYSDKQMAQLMGVRANVPRSYLGAAKRKLGLSAGPQLVLYVYFAGLVDSDALPLLTASGEGMAPSRLETRIPPGAPVEDLS